MEKSEQPRERHAPGAQWIDVTTRNVRSRAEPFCDHRNGTELPSLSTEYTDPSKDGELQSGLLRPREKWVGFRP